MLMCQCTAGAQYYSVKMGKKVNTVVIISLVVAGIAYYISKVREGIIVTTKNGQVKGIISLSRDGRDFYEWRGIPFGKPPVGDLRFRDPQPAEPWQGVRDGSSYGNSCVQSDFMAQMVTGQEDCLYLNVYTPKLADDDLLTHTKLPVIVEIYGGGYSMIGGEIYPDFFMDEDVVFVTFNYRVAVFGFLTTGDKVIRGNMGLKDQTLALKWVKENIASFGGDPNRVTIHGISAGGASVHQQTLSKMSKGLFQRAISHSGAATNPWGFITLDQALEKKDQLAKELNCPASPSDKFVECMTKLDAYDVIRAEAKLFTKDHMMFLPHIGGLGFVPTVEAVDDDAAFVAEHPLKIVAKGKAHGVPHLMGHTHDEGVMSTLLLRQKPKLLEVFDSNLDAIIQRQFQLSPKTSKKTIQSIRDLYISSSSLNSEQRLENYTKLLGDSNFAFDLHETADLQRKYSLVYFYLYTKADGPSISPLIYNLDQDNLVISGLLTLIKFFVGEKLLGMELERFGVDHAEDMLMLFAIRPFFGGGKGSKHYQLSKDYVRLMVDFAKDDQNASFRGIKLSPLPKEGAWNVLEVKDVPKIIPHPFQDRLKVLQELNIRSY